MRDFTIKIYKNLLTTLQQQGFSFLSFEEFMVKNSKRCIILRHDVDLLPRNSLQFARIQTEAGIRGTYYFRSVPESWNESIIREIAGMGHEVGYHYEDVSTAAGSRRKAKGGRQKHNSEKLLDFQDCKTAGPQDKGRLEKELADIAIESFSKNLLRLRELAPVKTICMHGSPMSRWDSRLLWKYYDYRDFGIIGEPYFDINFDEVLYLTDTGRRWDGSSVNIRDKAEGGRLKAEEKAEGRWRKAELKAEGERQMVEGRRIGSTLQPSALSPQPLTPFPRFHSTFDIIIAAEKRELPDKIMMTFHPQRWTDKPGPWVKELVWQNVKNVGKYFLIRLKAEGSRRKEVG